jgi:DNA-binding NarL/FixJ family response regulator
VTTVLLVDDHRVVRGGLRQVMDAEPDLEVVGEAGSLAEGIRAVTTTSPDVVVCDVSMGDGSGIDLVRTCRNDSASLGLVVLTMHGDDDVLFAALDAGASSLVLKSAHLDELLDAVRRAAVSPDMFSAAGLAAAMRRRSANPPPMLTPRETDVLNLLKDGLSVHEVSRRLFLSDSTVKTHVAKLYDKLGATNRAQAIMTAIRLHLVNPESSA